MSGTTTIPRKKKLPMLQIPTDPESAVFLEENLKIVEAVPCVFISSYHSASDKSALVRKGITHILNLADPRRCPNRFEGEFQYLSMPLSDSPEVDISQKFHTAFQFLDEAILSGGKVLIHCFQGKSRAPTIACAYIIQKFQLVSAVALDIVRKAQPAIDPNLGFVSQLELLAQSVLQTNTHFCLGQLDSCILVE